MVDVGDKEVTQRVAVARSKIRMAASTLAAIESSELKKGDALATARIAAIQAAKKDKRFDSSMPPLTDH